MLLFDRLQNLVSGLGTSKDKRIASVFAFNPIDPQQLVAMHRSDWMARKVVDIIPDDMTREWREWKADEKVVGLIEDVERSPRINIQAKVNEAMQLGRLRGGSVMVLGVNSGRPEDELIVDRVGKGALKYVHVLSRDQITYQDINRDLDSPYFGEPAMWQYTSKAGQMVNIHPSRVIRFVGAPIIDKATAPDEIWGDSVLQVVYDAIQNAASSQEHIASMLNEAKTDVIYIPGLSKHLENAATTQKLTSRFTYANTLKSMFNMLLLEGNGTDQGEKWEQKQISFAQMPELMMQFMKIASGAAHIPLLRFLEDAPSGLGSNGEMTLKNYYDRIGAGQRNVLSPALWRFDEVCIRSATGTRDPDIYYEWAPLYSQTEKERAEVFKIYADGARAIVGTGDGNEIITREAISDALVNRIVEDGNLPGLEGYIDEYGKLDEQEPSEEERAAAAAQATVPPQNALTADASPKTLYVRRDVVNAAEIKAWAEGQGLTDIVPDMHVTIVYSRTAMDWIKAGNVGEWNQEKNGQLIIPAGGPRVVEPLGNMSAVLMFASSLLSWRHEEIVRAGASHDYPDYQPHISITKEPADLTGIEPYRGKIVLGAEIFEELKQD